MVHREGLNLTVFIVSAALSCDRDERAGMVRNVFLSDEDEVSPALLTTVLREGEHTKGHTLGERREKFSVLIVSSEPDLRRIREQNASLAAAVNEYKVLVKIMEKKMNDEEPSGTRVLRELKRSTQETERLERENELL